MTPTQALLDRLKAARGLDSDYKLAKLLKVSRARVSSWRTGTHEMDETTAVQVAQELGEDPLAVLAILKLEKPHKPREANVWGRYRPRLLAAALAAFVVATSVTPQPVKAAPEVNPLYIMRSWLRRLERGLAWWAAGVWNRQKHVWQTAPR